MGICKGWRAFDQVVYCCRRRQLLERDPVNNLKVSSFLAEKLTEAAAVHGPAFHNAASSLDPTLESQLRVALGQTT
jgi:hypothetical protein